MNYYVFFALVAIILLMSFVIGKQSSAKTEAEYFLSSRSLSTFKVAMTILATQLGGGAIMGTAEAAYNHGWPAIAYSAGLALGLFILSLGIGARFRKMEVSTVPEIFKKYYNSDVLRIFSSVLYIISMFLILVAIGVSARKFALSVGFNNEITYIVFWLIMIAYTSTGGLTAVTKTDILQVIFILVSFIITFILLNGSSTQHLNRPFIPHGKELPWLSWMAVPCLFAIIGQDMAQRCFAAQSSKTVSRAAIIAAILLTIASALPVYLGIRANQLGFEAIEGGSILIKVISETTNPYVASIFACSILMAILSTADSLLCAISSNIALDFHFLRKQTLKNINLSKLITVIIGLSAMALSYFSQEIIPIMLVAYEISVSALAVPIIMTTVLKSPSKLAAYSSSFGGIASYVTFNVLGCLYKDISAVAVSLITFLLAESFMRLKLKA